MRLRFQHTGLPLGAVLGLILLGLGLGGCQSNEAPASYVARVGDHYLTSDDLARRLGGLGAVRDSSAARQQVIDQWISRTLLYREAERQNLTSLESVQRRLERQRRSILVNALKNRLYKDSALAPSPSEVRTYFERHKEKLQLREPYVRVWYLSTAQRPDARAVRRALQSRSPMPDSTWSRLMHTHAADTTQAQRLSRRYLPESRLTQQLPFLADVLDALQDGETSPIVPAEGQFHVLRLGRRLSAGRTPKLEWVTPQIRRRLRIRTRKQMYANEVERLRSKAQARGVLDTP